MPSGPATSHATPQGKSSAGTTSSRIRAPTTRRYGHSRPCSPRACANRANCSSAENA